MSALVPLALTGLILGLLLCSRWIPLRFLTDRNLVYEPAEPNPASQAVAVEIKPAQPTLTVFKPNTIVIPPVPDLPDSLSEIAVRVNGCILPVATNAAEMKRGTKVTITPTRPGQLHLEWLAAGHQIASARLVAVTTQPAPTEGRDYEFVADKNSVVFTPGAGFSIPISIQSVVRSSGGGRTPAPCLQQTKITVAVTATSTVLSGPHASTRPADVSLHELLIRTGEALSNSFTLPLSPAVGYHLVAHISGGAAEPLDECDVDWSSTGPKLQLQAAPGLQTTYSTAQTPARVTLCYTYQGQQVSPPLPATIVGATSSADVHLSESSVSIGPSNPMAAIDARGGSWGETAIVTFPDPLFGTVASAKIVYRFPTESLFVAIICGSLGVVALLAYTGALSATKKTAITIIIGLVGGLLVYLLTINGILPYPGGGNPVGLLPACMLGMVGGYAGQTLWETGVGLLHLKPPQ